MSTAAFTKAVAIRPPSFTPLKKIETPNKNSFIPSSFRYGPHMRVYMPLYVLTLDDQPRAKEGGCKRGLGRRRSFRHHRSWLDINDEGTFQCAEPSAL